MSHLLPPTNSPIRELFEVADLVEIGLGRYPGDRADASRKARAFFAAEPRAKALITFAVNAETDELQLLRFGPRGGRRVLWTFGGWLQCRL